MHNSHRWTGDSTELASPICTIEMMPNGALDFILQNSYTLSWTSISWCPALVLLEVIIILLLVFQTTFSISNIFDSISIWFLQLINVVLRWSTVLMCTLYILWNIIMVSMINEYEVWAETDTKLWDVDCIESETSFDTRATISAWKCGFAVSAEWVIRAFMYGSRKDPAA